MRDGDMTDKLKPKLLPEWAPHSALWVGWPRLREEWGDDFEGARQEIAAFIHVAARFVPVKVAIGSAEALASAQASIDRVAELVELPTGDIWLRDTGPIITGTGGYREAQMFHFNGWGGKYLMEGDTETSLALAQHEGMRAVPHDLVLEGGAIDVDGEGRVLTTRQCLLNANRNPVLSPEDIEARIKNALSVETFVWLGDGLLNDHTDGHVDNIARFIAPGHAVCMHPSGDADPNAETLRVIERELTEAGLQVSTLPSPGLILDADGAPVPASHMNFTLTNGAVLMPVYEDRFSEVALAELRALFPRREVIGLPARHILGGGGSFHCMTRDIPA